MSVSSLMLVLLVRSAASMDAMIQDLVTPKYGEACGYQSCSRARPGVLNVHIVPHSHSELGQDRTFLEHYTGITELYMKSNINVKRILDFTITELWAREHRTFTWSDMAYFFHWWRGRDETVRRMVYQLLRQGRLQLLGGGWSMPDEAANSYHALIDQFTYSLRKLNATFLECGRPLVSWQADSFGHSREFASLMAQMGFDAHFINPISYDDELRRMQEMKLEMLWRGSDDLGAQSDIFTHKLFDGYWSPPGFCFGSLCRDPLLVTSDSFFKNIDERATVFLESMQQRQAPNYATQHLMVMMGRKHGYYDASLWFTNIDKLIDAVNAKGLGKVWLFYSSPACYLRAVHAERPVLPVKQDDFVPVAFDKTTHFSGQFTSRPTIKHMAREGHVYLQMAKQLQVLAKLRDNSALFEEFNWIMGVIQDHNVLSGSMRPYVKDYYTEKMFVAVQRSTLLLQDAFNKLRRTPPVTMYFRCFFNISSCPVTYGPNFYIVIYNPLSWPVSLPVRLPIDASPATFTVLKLNQQKVKSSIIKLPDNLIKVLNRDPSETHELVFLAENIPALGLVSYFIQRTNQTMKLRRSIIKKINKSKNKKYLTRQVNNKLNIESELDKIDPNYDYDNDPIPSDIEFGNVNASNEYNFEDSYIVTPVPVFEVIEATEATEEPVTILVFDEEDTETTTEHTTTTKTEYTTTEYKTTEYLTTIPTTPEYTTTTTTTTTESNNMYVPSKDRFISNKYVNMYVPSTDRFISNKYVNISLDANNQVESVTLSNGVKVDLKIHILYYASDDPFKLRKRGTRPGANIFRPMDPRPLPIKGIMRFEVLKTDIVEELHATYSNYASFALKLYVGQPFIEIDWLVGPIPIDDELGKDVFMRYETDLFNNGVFYTDSNGRQTIKRRRYERGDYIPDDPRAIPGNFYPVTSKIYIEDDERNIRFAVFNDRAQGGTSLKDGQIDLMVHRRLLTDDSGTQNFLNDTEHGQGITVRGKHYLYTAKATHKPHRIFEKKFAKEIELAPQILTTPVQPYYNQTLHIWLTSKDFSGLKKKLPIGVHLLTLEEWNGGTILIRLENYLEKADAVKDGHKVVFLKDLFTNIEVKDIRETTLDGSKWIENHTPLSWMRQEDFYKSFNEAYGGKQQRRADDAPKPRGVVRVDTGIELTPQQIRTFVVWFDYVGIK